MRLLYFALRFCLLINTFLLVTHILAYVVVNYFTKDYNLAAIMSFSTAVIITYIVSVTLLKIDIFKH